MAFFQPSDGDMVITGNLHLLAVTETEGRRWKRPQVLPLFCLIYMPATLSGCLWGTIVEHVRQLEDTAVQLVQRMEHLISDGRIDKLIELVYDSFHRTLVAWFPYTAGLKGCLIVAGPFNGRIIECRLVTVWLFHPLGHVVALAYFRASAKIGQGVRQATEEEFHVRMVHGLGIAHTAERQYTAQHNYGDMFLAFLVCDI